MNLFPIVEGMPKELKAGITYALCSNGIFEVRALPGDGYVSTKIEGIKGLPEGVAEIRFLKKKIPISVFWEIVTFFRTVNKTFGSLEAYTTIAFNEQTEEYFLWTPPHIVGAASVRYDIEQFYKLPEHKNCYIVADFHLHPGEMGAFFSSTDNTDDCRDRFSGVIGKVMHATPDVKVRFSTGSVKIELTLADMFCEDDYEYRYNVAKGIAQIEKAQSVNVNVHTFANGVGYVPTGGKSLIEWIKEKRKEGFSVSDLLREE